jgi:hypothetical protein
MSLGPASRRCEESGTVTAFRVVKDGFGVNVESQFQGQGTMLGTPFVD